MHLYFFTMVTTSISSNKITKKKIQYFYSSNEAMKNMSRALYALYAGMCLKIGTAQQIGFRREIADTDELLTNQADRNTAMKKREWKSQRRLQTRWIRHRLYDLAN